MLGFPKQVVPQPCGLLVGIAVLAIGHIGPLQVCHEGPALQQPGLRILDAPEARAQVPCRPLQLIAGPWNLLEAPEALEAPRPLEAPGGP